jgi:hypothetical protein
MEKRQKTCCIIVGTRLKKAVKQRLFVLPRCCMLRFLASINVIPRDQRDYYSTRSCPCAWHSKQRAPQTSLRSHQRYQVHFQSAFVLSSRGKKLTTQKSDPLYHPINHLLIPNLIFLLISLITNLKGSAD